MSDTMDLRERIDSGRSSTTPRRRHRLVLDLHADTLDEARRALEGIAYRVAQAADGVALTQVTSGGCSSGWHLEHVEDPDMTAERYAEVLREWLERDRGDRE